MSTTSFNPVAGEFAIDQVWFAIEDLLRQELGDAIDVDSIGEKDFDEQGDLTINPPAARVGFADEKAGQPLDPQNATYNGEQMFFVVCAAEDMRGTKEQRLASLRLVAQIKHQLVGARLWLKDGTQTEPLIFAGTSPLPTKAIGMAYVAGFIVPNVAQFAAPNAYPTEAS